MAASSHGEAGECGLDEGFHRQGKVRAPERTLVFNLEVGKGGKLAPGQPEYRSKGKLEAVLKQVDEGIAININGEYCSQKNH